MNSQSIFAGAGMLGILSGLVLAQLTPVLPKPMKEPEWRQRAAALRDETSATFAYSMPEDLSPRVGFGNPAVHDSYARMPVQFAWVEPAPPPAEAVEAPAAPAPAVTGNEQTIAHLKVVSEGFDPAPSQAAPVEPELPVETPLDETAG